MNIPEFFRHIDVHTHVDAPGADRIVSITPFQDFGQASYYSVGIHPWDADRATPQLFQKLRLMAADPRVVAIGECGLDKAHLPLIPLSVQTDVFIPQAQLAEQLGKPLVIHCVRAWAELLALKKRLRPTVPWIIHGFRGNPRLAAQLVSAGFILSLPPRHNPELSASIPAHSLLHESDALPPSPQ